jgi:hypothetical protein
MCEFSWKWKMDNSVMRRISYQISSNLSNKWGKHVWKFIYAMRKLWLSLRRFLWNSESPNKVLWTAILPDFIKICRKSRNGGKFLLCHSPKNGFSLHRFSRNFHLLNNFTWISSTPNFNQIGQEMWIVGVYFLLQTLVQYDCHYFEFHNRKDWSIN